jgi:hypothetical protein
MRQARRSIRFKPGVEAGEFANPAKIQPPHRETNPGPKDPAFKFQI